MPSLTRFKDQRGELVPLEFNNLPFEPKRIFYVHHVPINTWRGGHAHYETQQFLICLTGKIIVKLESKTGSEEFTLDEGDSCFIDKMVWDSQNFIEENSVLLVICSTEYNPDDYIYDKSVIL